MVMPYEPFLLEPVSGEIFAAVTLPAWLACGALWRRAQVLQDRKDAADAAHTQRYADLLERNTQAFDRTATALEKALEAMRHAG